MWEEQTGESGRPSSHAKCKGNMTLLQLPNGDITICSATSLQISKHFWRVLGSAGRDGFENPFNTSEFKHNWVWNTVLTCSSAHLLFISFLLVLHVRVINVQRGRGGQYTTGCEKLFLIPQKLPVTQYICLISLTVFPIKEVVQKKGKIFLFCRREDLCVWVKV